MKFIGGFFLFLGGMVTGVAALAGGVAIYGAVSSVNSTLNMFGIDGKTVINEEYGNKSIISFIQTVSGKQFNNLNDVADLTPMVDDVYTKLDTAFKDGLGVALDKNGLYTCTFEGLGDYLMTYVKANVEIGTLLKLDANSNQALLYICYDKTDGAIDLNKPRTLETFTTAGFVSNLIDNALLSDLITIDPSDTILYSLRDEKINDLDESIKDLTLKDVMDIDGNSAKILQSLKDETIGNLGTRFGNLTLGEAVDVGDSKILAALATTKITEIGNKVDTLKLNEMMDIDTASPKILQAIANSTLKTLSADINNMLIVDIFEDEIWTSGVAHTAANADAIWKYMLTDATGTFRTDYRVTADMGEMTDNVAKNVNKATIADLVNDGFIDISDPAVLEKPAPGASGKKVGELTFAEFLEAYAAL